MGDKIQLQGSASLFKDIDNRAIINSDELGYKSALIRKEKKKEFDKLKKDIKDLQSRVLMLEETLSKVINT